MNKSKIFFVSLVILAISQVFGQEPQIPMKVVTTIPDYAVIAKAIGKERVSVKHIVEGNQDAHFIRPKPSFVSLVREADIFISTGLDLEMWTPTVVDFSGNTKIRSGQPGYIAAAYGVPMREKPEVFSKSEGDIHIYGNPHITCSPLNMRIVAQNIMYGFIKNDPGAKDFYRQNLKAFQYELDCRTYGKELVELLGGDTLAQLAQKNRLISFLETKRFRGKKLMESSGGWIKEMMPLRGKSIATYHKSWCYFLYLFGMQELITVEPKPGIPPSPKHVQQVIQEMKNNNVRIILAENYFNRDEVISVAEKVDAVPVIVPMYVGGEQDIHDYFQLVDYWVSHLLSAHRKAYVK